MADKTTYTAIVEHHSVGNVAVAGEQNVVHNTAKMPSTNEFPDGASIKGEIQALRQLLMEFVSKQDVPAVTHRLENAEHEAAQIKPDKAKISRWLKTALELAGEGDSLAKTAVKIGPHITKLAGWLGTEGAQLLKLAGLG